MRDDTESEQWFPGRYDSSFPGQENSRIVLCLEEDVAVGEGRINLSFR